MRKPFSVFLSILLTAVASTAAAQPDLVVELSEDLDNPTYVGTEQTWSFLVRNVSGVGFTSPVGMTLFEVTFPEGLELKNAVRGGCSLGCVETTCEISDQTVTCTTDAVYGWGGSGVTDITVEVTPTQAGSFGLTPPDLPCAVDVNNDVAESDETNNQCTWAGGPLLVRDVPGDLQTSWLQVSMWDNLARAYDLVGNAVTWAADVRGVDESRYHALNDIVRHPQTGGFYVFQRSFLANTHGLGSYEPGAGVTPIGDTGLSLFDAAFGPDGTLYALGRDRKIYTIDITTAAATQRCDTGLDAFQHFSLAWEPTEGLVIVGDRELRYVDSTAFPGAPSGACITNVVPLLGRLNDVFLAVGVGNHLYAANSGGRLQYVAPDGAVAELETMPISAHGMVPFDGAPPAPAVTCPAEKLVLVTQDSADSSSLFTVDPVTGDLGYLRELPFNRVSALELDSRSGDVFAAADEGQVVRLFRADPCGSAPASVQDLPVDDNATPYALDLGLDGVLRAAFRASGQVDVSTVDPDTAAVTSLGVVTPRSRAMAIHANEVIFTSSSGDSDFSTALSFYDLSNLVEGTQREVPLGYAADLPAGMKREVVGLDVGQAGKPLTGVLARTERNGSINTLNARPNALVEIDRAGQVTHLADLPVTAVAVAIRETGLLSDGFEGGIDGCFEDAGTWFDWTWGANTVSSEADGRPLWGYSDSGCLVFDAAQAPVAHADDLGEAQTLCQSIGQVSATLIAGATPSSGAFYRCTN